MTEEQRRSTRVASICAMAMVAWQVAGSAVCDSAFLNNYDVTSLPAMVIVSAVLSMGLVGFATRAMSRSSPRRFVGRAFVGSAVITGGLWMLSLWRPGWAAIGLFLQIEMVGAVLVSGFWSVVNEAFDPRTGKRSFMVIGRAATIGGLLGGVAADRVAAIVGHDWLLPMLAILHLVCAFQVRQVGTSLGAPRTDEGGPTAMEIFRERRYLQLLAALVILLTTGSGLVDYWFKAAVVEVWSGDELIGFFAWFYTGTSVLTFALQMVVAQWVLTRFGVARITAMVPALVVVGGLAGLIAPGIGTASLLRLGHTSLKNSLFRLAYELLFIPLDAVEKRRTKAFIDVGFRRVGDIAGGAVVSAVLLTGALWSPLMLLAMVVIALAAIGVSVLLDRGYVAELEGSLMRRAEVLDPFGEIEDALTAEVLTQTLRAPELARNKAGALSSMLLSRGVRRPAGDRPAIARTPSQPVGDPLVDQVAALRSPDPARVKLALLQPLGPEHVGHLIPLLAWDDVTRDVSRALSSLAPRCVGQLVDALTAPETDFAVRRRIPVTLATGGRRAVDGLLLGLGDERFEVRYRCGRVLLEMRRRDPDLAFDSDLVEQLVLREADVERSVWEGRRLLDHVMADGESWLGDAFLRERSSRSIEHVFTLLGLALPPEPLAVAFRGLHTEDAALVGTALEYLDLILPPKVRSRLWPLLTDLPPRTGGGSPEEALDALLRSQVSIQLHLRDLRKADADRVAADA